MNPYEILGVKKDATMAEIKKAWRNLAADNHPDRAGGDPKKMAEINAAYRLLRDPERRAAYDANGELKAPDSIEQQARNLILSFLESNIANMHEDTDLIAATKQFLSGKRGELRSTQQQNKDQTRKCEKRRKRLKGPPDSFILWWLERRLQQLNEHAETMKKAEDVIVKAFEALEGFSWDGPAKEYRPNAFLTMD